MIWTSRPAALAVILSALAGTPAFAQQGLPPQVVEAVGLTDADRNRIRQFVESQLAGLNAGDELSVQRARAALVEPLTGRQPSVSFRLEYSRLLEEPLQRILRARPPEHVAVNALRILGELATPQSAQILAQSLGDQRPTVRYGAAFGAKRVFEHLRSAPPALAQNDARQLLNAVAERLRRDDDPYVLEGYVRAFEAAATVPDSRVRGVRIDAAGLLVREMADRLQVMNQALAQGRPLPAGDPVPAAIRAAEVLRNAATRQGLPAGEPPLPDQVLVQIGGFAGDIFAHAGYRLQSGQLDDAARPHLAIFVAAGEAMYFFAHTELRQGNPLDGRLAQAFGQGGGEGFVNAVEQFIGPRGVLTSAPFNFQPQRFRPR